MVAQSDHTETQAPRPAIGPAPIGSLEIPRSKKTNVLLCVLVGIILLSLCYSSGVYAEVTVSVDRNPVQINESFRIVFESDVSGSDKPDFTPLKKDFDIISQGQSSNIRIINGDYSATTQWTLDVMA